MGAALGSSGAQKALSFLTLMVFGRLTKGRFPAARMAGIQQLILDIMLPCVIFKALASIELSLDLIKWPVLGALAVFFQVATLAVVGRAVFPGRALGVPRRSAVYQLATMAPGLSAIVFVKEFVGAEAAGFAALFDLPSKLYMIFILPRLLERAAAAEGGDDDAKGTKKTTKRPRPSLAALAGDPLNVAIAGGLAMAATAMPYARLGFLGTAVDALAATQTPTLFVLVGMKLKLSGTTPAACAVLLAARHAAMYAFHALATRATTLTGPDQMTLLLLNQAAVSVIGWSQISKLTDQGVRGYSPDFAFDIVGFSMPLSMGLQTAACLADAKKVLGLVPAAAAVLAALAFGLFVPLRSRLQDPYVWRTSSDKNP